MLLGLGTFINPDHTLMPTIIYTLTNCLGVNSITDQRLYTILMIAWLGQTLSFWFTLFWPKIAGQIGPHCFVFHYNFKHLVYFL